MSEKKAWELVTDTRDVEATDRLEVPGGWLYRTLIIPYTEDGNTAVAMVFVPRPPRSLS